jgi:hypothetical protein
MHTGDIVAIGHNGVDSIQTAFGATKGRAIIAGSLGVYVFFALSGYLLARPFMRSFTTGAPQPAASAACVSDHPARSTRSTSSSRPFRLSLALACNLIRCPPWDWWLRHQPASKEARMNNVIRNYS